MEVFERIELRRFVGRELILWLWLESELFEGTLTTKAHGSFGMWLEGRLVLSAGQEVTTIKGTMPGRHREAKEALLRGKMPELAGLHLAWSDHEATFTLKAETLAIAGLKLPKGDSKSERKTDEPDEELYERMRITREIEGVVEALYRDFLALRLGPAWDALVTPALEAWCAGDAIDADAYGTARTKALAATKGSPRK